MQKFYIDYCLWYGNHESFYDFLQSGQINGGGDSKVGVRDW